MAARTLGVSTTVAKVLQNSSFQALVQIAALQSYEREDNCLPFSLLGPQFSQDEPIRLAVTQCDISPSEIEVILPVTPLQAEFVESSVRKAGAYMAQTQYTFPNDVSIGMTKAIWTKVHEHSSCSIVSRGLSGWLPGHRLGGSSLAIARHS